jgi:hypothetical protein
MGMDDNGYELGVWVVLGFLPGCLSKTRVFATLPNFATFKPLICWNRVCSPDALRAGSDRRGAMGHIRAVHDLYGGATRYYLYKAMPHLLYFEKRHAGAT